MGDHRAAVDTYISASAAFARPVLEHLRALIHTTCPDTREAIKWSMPFFLHGETHLCNMAAFRAHCAFGFWDRRMTPLLAERGVLCGTAMGSLGRIRSLEDLPEDATLTALLRQARLFAGEPKQHRLTLSRPPRPEPAAPDDLLAALRTEGDAAERFTTMSPSCRREYVEWVLEAKRPETRERRIREATAMIAEGRQHNSRYGAR